jgi:hypothetical protein
MSSEAVGWVRIGRCLAGVSSTFDTFVSNQRMSEPCTGNFDCRTWPIEGLPPGGVVLKWSSNGSPVGTSMISAAGRSG